MSDPAAETPRSLVHVGIRGHALALDAATGEIVWKTRLSAAWASGFVTLALVDDLVIAACSGHVYGLDASSGRVLWHQPLKGMGHGMACLATDRSTGSSQLTALAQAAARQAAAAAAAG